MAEFRQFTYSSSGTEIEFAKGLTDLICSFDSSFTVSDTNGNVKTIEQIYSEELGAFQVNFGNGQVLRFTRRNGATAGGQSWNTMFGNIGNSNTLYSSANLTIDTAANRQFFIAYFKSDNLLMLWLGSYNISAITSTVGCITMITHNNEKYVGGINNYTPLSFDLIGSNSTGRIYPIAMNYSVGAGSIDYIDRSQFVSGGAKLFEVSDVYSCSNMNSFSSIALPNGKNFFTIGTNAMVEVDPS